MKRIDAELVERKLFETRAKAQYAISNGIVYCNNQKVLKKSFLVSQKDEIKIKGNKLPYVSKGGLKLEKALKVFDIQLSGKKMIDIGSSTGGFTDCALQHGINYVLAVDVGKLQFSSKLRNDKRIKLMEQTDFRKLKHKSLIGYTIAVIDISFISATKLLGGLGKCPDLNEIVLLIKPQFECGIQIANRYKGVILNKKVHLNILNAVVKSFNSINYGIFGLTYSPIKGGSGNIEYLAYFKLNINNKKIKYEDIILEAFSKLI